MALALLGRVRGCVDAGDDVVGAMSADPTTGVAFACDMSTVFRFF